MIKIRRIKIKVFNSQLLFIAFQKSQNSQKESANSKSIVKKFQMKDKIGVIEQSKID